jgi:cysteine-rich repeat protein
VTLAIKNDSFGGEIAHPVYLESVKHRPSCKSASAGACTLSADPANDPGVFAFNGGLPNTATGEVGSSCAGVEFTVTLVDASTGEWLFTPPTPTTITLPAPSPGPATDCLISFNVDVLKFPADADLATDGLQTDQHADASGRSKTNTTLTGSGSGTDTTTVEGCGDGIINGGEFCDDGNTINTDACRNDCTACGDGIKNGGEFCDDGNTINTDACRNDCTACGDGIKNGGEFCDDGNTINTDACRNDCTACGDGIKNGSEFCDDGNTINTDACRNDCTACGDGVIQANHGELCEPPGTLTCDANCQPIQVVGACRMTGGHVNKAGDDDASYTSPNGKYTTGGQIGAPNESGCCDYPHPKGICVNNSCLGGGEPGKACTTNGDCPQTNKGCDADCPWGDWQHNHHSGLDDSYLTKGGSFSFHSGTAAAPATSFISNVVCADEGWCVQARPAPDKQIFWEGYGVFHNLKGPKGQDLSQPGFPAGCNVTVYDSKTGGTLHYYKAHVGDFGESKGPGQRQAPVTPTCELKNFDGDWDIACGSVEPVALLGGAKNQKFTDLHPLCEAQDCTTCPDWYDIEISCDTKKPGDIGYQAAYKVAHFILQGNFQLHPAVCTSCQPCGDALCQTEFEESCISCCKDCCPAECL